MKMYRSSARSNKPYASSLLFEDNYLCSNIFLKGVEVIVGTI